VKPYQVKLALVRPGLLVTPSPSFRQSIALPSPPLGFIFVLVEFSLRSARASQIVHRLIPAGTFRPPSKTFCLPRHHLCTPPLPFFPELAPLFLNPIPPSSSRTRSDFGTFYFLTIVQFAAGSSPLVPGHLLSPTCSFLIFARSPPFACCNWPDNPLHRRISQFIRLSKASAFGHILTTNSLFALSEPFPFLLATTTQRIKSRLIGHFFSVRFSKCNLLSSTSRFFEVECLSFPDRGPLPLAICPGS